MKKICLVMLILTIISITGCSKQESVKITSVKDLEGRRVGVVMARGPDWYLEFLEDRPNIEIARYDEMVDIMLALKFHKLDALLLDDLDAKSFMRLQGDGYILHESVLPPVDNSIMFSNKDEALVLKEEFNLFIEEFRKTEEYADIIFRANDTLKHEYVSKKVPITPTTDRVIRVAFPDTKDPSSYIDPADGELKGSLVEIVSHFANSIGADMEVITGNMGVLKIALFNGDAELLAFEFITASKHILEKSNYSVLSEPVTSVPMSLISKE